MSSHAALPLKECSEGEMNPEREGAHVQREKDDLKVLRVDRKVKENQWARTDVLYINTMYWCILHSVYDKSALQR